MGADDEAATTAMPNIGAQDAIFPEPVAGPSNVDEACQPAEEKQPEQNVAEEVGEPASPLPDILIREDLDVLVNSQCIFSTKEFMAIFSLYREEIDSRQVPGQK